MSAAPIEISEVEQEARDFVHAFKTLHLATADENAVASATYAPYALDNDNFIIYVSDLSAHTPNLHRGENVSVMLIESEQDAEHLFARKRLTFKCEVQKVARDSEEFDRVMDLMQERFGDFISYMKKLQDFHAFRLKPVHAGYVRGFAQAYEFKDADFSNIRHVNDKGHKDSD
ncbi:MAG: pyridoxamine 5'-phosphate oxidase family protein [Pseudomonadota bacterium]